MLNYETINILARQRSLLESFNRKVKGGVVAEHIPGGFCFLEELISCQKLEKYEGLKKLVIRDGQSLYGTPVWTAEQKDGFNTIILKPADVKDAKHAEIEYEE